MSVAADLDRIAAHFPRIESHLVDAAYCSRCDEAVSKWGVGQQLLHLLRAQKMICGGIAQMLATAAAGPALLAPPPGDVSDIRKQILASGIPRGLGDSPAFLRVDAPPSFAEIERELADARAAFGAIAPRAADIEVSTATFAHHRLGNMNAAEWLRFIVHHNELHLAIIDDILAATAPA